MQYPVYISGMEGQSIVIEPPTLSSAAKLIVNGVVVPTGPNRNQRLLILNNGQQVIAELKQQFVDPLPILSINGYRIPYVAPFAWYEWIIAASPLILIFIGGALGGALGGLAAYVNGAILRSQMPIALRYVAVLGLGTAAWVLYLMAAVAFHLMIHPHLLK